MWKSFYTALFCLLAFIAEIGFDPSTNFVRVAQAAQAAPGMYADGFVGSVHHEKANDSEGDSTDLGDLLQNSAVSHASCSEAVITFPSYTVAVALLSSDLIPYEPPTLRLAHRPPILSRFHA